MATSILQIVADAYLDAGTDQTITSFSMTEWPFSAALNIVNSAIADLNRLGSYSFAEAELLLPYTAGVGSYDLNTVGPYVIEPRRIMRLRRELLNQAGELTEYNYRDFQKRFRANAVPTQKPFGWAKFGGTLFLNSIPDQDYQLTLYYYQQIQPIVVGVNDNSPTIVPEYHTDVLRDMTKACLLKEMQRPDFANQYALAKGKADKLLARSNEDVGMPTSLPRTF